MKFFKPAWVGHDGNPIFSIDIHPDGTRFATGGQGPEKCGRVIIWNMAPIMSPKDEAKVDVPKKLCQMDNHLACINCVRWSNDGKYLASAGDDKNLMIWQLAGRVNHHSAIHQSQSNVFESANIEQWRCIATLNGHNGDILDLGWAAGDYYLASCSVDNMIIVWDATNFPQMITKITGHTGLVKGVSWDPAGKYLASQSDDKTLRIWRTSDWKEETAVKEPFKECGGTTHVLRLNWSPDGQTLVSAHAMNNSGSVAQLIERDGWRIQRDLVGHRKAVTCVRFNPNLLYQHKTKKQPQQSSDRSGTNDNNNETSVNNNASSNGTSKANSITTNSAPGKTVKYCCIAVGSRDRSISVWLTSQPRPLIVAHDLFESSVLDISWSKDGYRLLACSQDGTVAALMFSAAEIGHKLTSEERQAHFQKLYGKSINTGPPATKTIIVEDPELIKAPAENSQKNRDMLDQQSSHSNSVSQNGFNGCESNTSMSAMSKGPTDRQIETLLPGGKRRITPLYIQPPLPFNSTSSITFSSSKESKTKIMIETTTSTPAPTPTPSLVPSTPVKAKTIPTIQREHIIAKTSNTKTLAPSKVEKVTIFRVTNSENKDRILEAENEIGNDKLNELRLLDKYNNRLWDVLLSNKINSVIATPTLAAASCIDNSLNLFDLESGHRLIPALVLDSQVAHMAAEKSHVLVITSSANMWLWDLSKNKVLVKAESVTPLLSPTNTTSPPSTNNEKLPKAQGRNSEKSSKNDDNQNNQANANQDSETEILSCSLSHQYQPLLLLSTGKAFVFDYNLHCWLLISDSNDYITRWSKRKPSMTAVQRFLNYHKVDSSSKKRSMPLTILQSQHLFDIKRFAGSMNKSDVDSLQVKATQSYLDQQLVAALAIRSDHEYHYWLMQSVYHYMETGAEDRLKDLCLRLVSSVMGGDDNNGDDSRAEAATKAAIEAPDNNSSKQNRKFSLTFGDISGVETNDHVLGLSKIGLLREVLDILADDLRYQRLHAEYRQMLDYKSKMSVTDMNISEG